MVCSSPLCCQHLQIELLQSGTYDGCKAIAVKLLTGLLIPARNSSHMLPRHVLVAASKITSPARADISDIPFPAVPASPVSVTLPPATPSHHVLPRSSTFFTQHPPVPTSQQTGEPARHPAVSQPLSLNIATRQTCAAAQHSTPLEHRPVPFPTVLCLCHCLTPPSLFEHHVLAPAAHVLKHVFSKPSSGPVASL